MPREVKKLSNPKSSCTDRDSNPDNFSMVLIYSPASYQLNKGDLLSIHFVFFDIGMIDAEPVYFTG